MLRSVSASAGGGGGGVTSFNSRTGAVTQTSGDITGALGYTPLALLRSYIAGCTLSNNGGAPSSKMDVLAGQVADDSNAAMISVSAGTIDCGITGANGLDTGSLANATWYHAFVIAKTDGTQALLASTSLAAPTMPSGYTLKRRIGSFLTDGSAAIKAFTQVGDIFYWASLPTDVQVTNLGTAATLYTLSTPPGVKTRPIMRVGAPTVNSAVLISSPDEPDLAPPSGSTPNNSETSPGFDFCYNTNPAGDLVAGIYTNTSSQIRARADAASRHLTIFTRGYIDDRGRYD
jgi:hypothetical protein